MTHNNFQKLTDAESCDLIAEFVAQADVADSTRVKYRAHLHAFLGWLSQNADAPDRSPLLLHVTPGDVHQFMAYLRTLNSSRRLNTPLDAALAPSTRRTYLASLRSFYRFCVAVRLVDVDPSASVRPPRVILTPGLQLSASELRRLLDAHGSARDRIQTYLLVFTAARSAELRNLRWHDIDFVSRTICLRGKRGKVRTVDIHPELMGELRHWAVSQNEQGRKFPAITVARGNPETDFVLLSRRGNPLQASTLYRQLAQRACSAGLYPLEPGRHEARSKVSPHALRRSFATLLLNDGQAIDAVADVLGHSSLDTTRRHYAFSGNARRRATIEAFHV